MNDNVCEKCKYRDEAAVCRPCLGCKYSAQPGSPFYDTAASFFTLGSGEMKEVDHPAHYEGKYECIDVMLDTMGPEDVKGFCLCNAFKYLWRCKKKHETPEEDVEKAVWYLQKYLELGGDA